MGTYGDLKGSVARTIATLDVLAGLGQGAHALGEIQRKVGLHTSTVHRILNTGIELGRVSHDVRGEYEYIWPKALGHTFLPADQTAGELGVSGAAWQALESLQAATGAMVTMHGLFWLGPPRHMCSIAITGGDAGLEALLAGDDPRLHRPKPLLCGAAGHAMLAAMRPRAQMLAELGRNKVGELWWEPIAQEPEAIVAQGYARTVSPQGHETLAVALLGSGEVCGALGLTTPEADASGTQARALKLQKSVDYIYALLDAPGSPDLLAA
jgi:DNA-binding IclR family transcriptional regulator